MGSRDLSQGVRDQGLGIKVKGFRNLWFKDLGQGFRDQGFESRVQGSWVKGLGISWFGVKGLGIRGV